MTNSELSGLIKNFHEARMQLLSAQRDILKNAKKTTSLGRRERQACEKELTHILSSLTAERKHKATVGLILSKG